MNIRSLPTRVLDAFTLRTAAKGFLLTRLANCERCSRFLDAMQDVGELRALTTWKAHALTGDRKGTWSLSVTGNHHLTFTIDGDGDICDLDLEDYH